MWNTVVVKGIVGFAGGKQCGENLTEQTLLVAEEIINGGGSRRRDV